jgi:hypothetical protein
MHYHIVEPPPFGRGTGHQSTPHLQMDTYMLEVFDDQKHARETDF